MKILLIAATQNELEPMLSDKTFIANLAAKHTLEILITGIGMPQTIFQLTNYCSQNTVELIVQAGIAGSFEKEIALGSTCIIENEYFGDMGVEENEQFYDLFDKQFLDPHKKPFTQKALRNPTIHPLNMTHLPIKDAITVNEITTNWKRIQQLKEKYTASLESMEGAALHYTALELKIPFLQIRSVSNYVGERDKSKWNMALAIKNLNEHTMDLITAI